MDAVGYAMAMDLTVQSNPATAGTVTSRAGFPSSGQMLPSASINGKIYALDVNRYMYVYNPDTNSWGYDNPASPAMSPVAGNMSAGVAVGSLTYWHQTDKLFYAYDPVTRSWTQKANALYNNSLQFTAVGTDIYAYGKYSDPQSFARYNTLTNVWTALANPPSEQSYAAVGHDGKGNILVGRSLSTIHVYNIATATWTTKNLANPQDRNLFEHGKFFAVGPKVFVLSGWDNYLHHLLDLDFVNNKHTIVGQHGVLSSDQYNRQGFVEMINEMHYSFIGRSGYDSVYGFRVEVPKVGPPMNLLAYLATR